MKSILFQVNKTGLASKFQDAGRYGYQRFGVVAAGAMDPNAFKYANLLVGNPIDYACLEMCLLGPTLQLQSSFTFAICGANLSPCLNGEAIELWRTYTGKKGDTLSFGACIHGNYAYLAVSGGYDCEVVLGSQSTYSKANMGSELKKGSPITGFPQCLKRNRWLDRSIIPTYTNEITVRYIHGPHLTFLEKQSIEMFENQQFTFSLGDRMGYRLRGTNALSHKDGAHLPTSPVPLGGIQIPPDGNPIVMLADHQTTGGYPLIGTVITSDLPALAQLPRNGTIRFIETTIEEAQMTYRKLFQQFNLHRVLWKSLA